MSRYDRDIQDVYAVKQLGDAIGYGHLMAIAHELWARLLEDKQFDELIPPPKGAVYQNYRGTTVLCTSDFEEIYDVWCRANEDGDAE